MSSELPGRVVAFYSFKGGTGRSMALANIGCIMAQASVSAPVLLVDWDLEAPGLHRYFRKHLYQTFRGSEESQERSPGLIELFIALQARIDKLGPEAAHDFNAADSILRDIPLDEYVIKTDIPRLHLIKAGRFDADYPAKIAGFQWPLLYQKSPSLLRAFSARLCRDYGYVLIDSRTGLTDTSGICTMLLPEVLVTVFTPNRQSLSGVVDLIKQAGRYRSQSDDLRPLLMYPLPSRIEASEPGLRQQWRVGETKAGIEGFQRAFEQAFKEIYDLPQCDLGPYFDDIQIQHVPRYAYGEEIAVLIEESRDRFSLTRSYQRFATKLLQGELPWAAIAVAESAIDESRIDTIDVDSELTQSSGEEASRRREADAYLRRAATGMERLELQARRLRYLQVLLVIAATMMLVLIPAIGMHFAEVVSASVAAAAAIAMGYLSRRITTLKLSIAWADKEIKSFKQQEAPYDTDEALVRLAARVDPVLLDEAPISRKKTGRIYISYRRQDSGVVAGRLYDALCARFGNERVLMDTDSIPFGVDFTQYIENQIKSADVMVVVIGPDWLATDSTGRPRLDNRSDVVRVELECAFRDEIRVIPALVDRARMPDPSRLPDSIRKLAVLNPAHLDVGADWRSSVARLQEGIARVILT